LPNFASKNFLGDATAFPVPTPLIQKQFGNIRKFPGFRNAQIVERKQQEQSYQND